MCISGERQTRNHDMLIKYVEVHRRDFDSMGFSGKFEEEMASLRK
jgi:hypothetical protein